MRRSTTVLSSLAVAAALGACLPVPVSAVAAASEHYWIDQLHLEQAWATSRGDGITVGVLDTGVNAEHPDLVGAVLPGRAFPDLGQGVRDAHGHGTTVAMLIAGRGHDGATTGVAPGARILPVTTSGTADSVSEAIRWMVDQGVDVINLSVGRSRSSSDRAVALLDAALGYAARHDVIVVAAAGNSSTDQGVTSPANRPGVLAVSAVDADGRFRPEVSVSGPEVALAAPGVAVVTAAEAKPAGRHLSPDGTSYSSALVSGVMAVVRAAFPNERATQIVQRVLTTARPAGPEGRDVEYGHGIVDPVAALAKPAKPAPPAEPGIPWWLITPMSAGALIALAVAGALLRRRSRAR